MRIIPRHVGERVVRLVFLRRGLCRHFPAAKMTHSLIFTKLKDVFEIICSLVFVDVMVGAIFLISELAKGDLRRWKIRIFDFYFKCLHLAVIFRIYALTQVLDMESLGARR